MVIEVLHCNCLKQIILGRPLGRVILVQYICLFMKHQINIVTFKFNSVYMRLMLTSEEIKCVAQWSLCILFIFLTKE